MKLVKILNTDEYQIINDSDFDSNIHLDRTEGIAYWELNNNLADYCFIRHHIMAIIDSVGFNNLKSEEEKEICIKYTKSVPATDIVPYYMSTGMTYNEASYAYLQKRAIDVRNAADCYSARLNKPEFTVIIMKHLGEGGGITFLDNCRNFISDIRNSAILGTEYESTMDGFFDYVDDTGGYDTVPGLSSFFDIPTEQANLDLMRKEIKDLIYYGYTT